MFELICNCLLWLALVYVWFFHAIEAPIPVRVERNPYALNPDIWPKAIIILLLIFIAVNIVKIIRKNRGNPDFALAPFMAGVGRFISSRTFLGVVLVIGGSFILDPLGFMGTCFLMLFLYGMLLGDRRVVRLLIMSILLTIVLYIVFSVLLSVNLPRGTIPQARDFALWVESLVSELRSAATSAVN